MKNKWCVSVAFLFFLVGICINACTQECNSSNNDRWSEEKIQKWYDDQDWLIGCNYIPATAINQIEMWSADTFNPKQIDKGFLKQCSMEKRCERHEKTYG